MLSLDGHLFKRFAEEFQKERIGKFLFEQRHFGHWNPVPLEILLYRDFLLVRRIPAVKGGFKAELLGVRHQHVLKRGPTAHGKRDPVVRPELLDKHGNRLRPTVPISFVDRVDRDDASGVGVAAVPIKLNKERCRVFCGRNRLHENLKRITKRSAEGLSEKQERREALFDAPARHLAEEMRLATACGTEHQESPAI